MSNSLTHPIVILSGEENAGKSTLCRKITDYAKTRKIMVSGILSELETVKDQKKAINSFDIKSGEKINLAVYSPGWDKEKKERKWKFNREAINWGNHILRNSVPTDLLIIDEVGYLELEKGEGWKECFNILEGNQYQLAIIVIRLELLSLIIYRYSNISVLMLQKQNRMEIEEKIIDELNRLLNI